MQIIVEGYEKVENVSEKIYKRIKRVCNKLKVWYMFG